MDIRGLDNEQFVDIFGDPNKPAELIKPRTGFGSNGGLSTDLTADSSITDTTTASTTDTTTIAIDASLEGDNTPDLMADGNVETEEEKKAAGRKKKYDFSDISGYFEDRIKTGRFVPIHEDSEDGESKVFLPSTPEEFDEVIDMQVDYRLSQEREKLESSWYQSKSPAWQAVAKYAEYTEDPSELVPFINGVKNIESVANYNEEEADGAERIIRARLQQKGDSQDIIDEQIDALKTTDRLISTAKKYKPVIIQEEKKQLNQMMVEKQRQEQEYSSLVHTIRDNVIKTIEAPMFGKQKLKNEEKLAIYEMIGEPEGSKGFRLYTEIDKLFEAGKFSTLAKVALLLANEESLTNYIATGASDNTAANLQKKLRIATDSRTASSAREMEQNEPQPAMQRKYSVSGGFGRK